MRELYLIGCLVLGTGAVFATMAVVKYKYEDSKQVPKDIGFITPLEEEKQSDPPTNRSSEIIHAKDLFDPKRGEAEKVVADEEPPPPPVSPYSFELRGINIVGNKKVALLTAQAVRSSKTSSRSSRSSGRSSSPVTSSSSKVHIVAEGEEIDETGYKVKSIVAGKVIVTDSAGKEQPPLIFSLISDSSLKRAELSYKNELSRQKSFANQNKFPTSTKKAPTPTAKEPAKPTDPKQMTKEQREAEMRKRAENLKAEMKRLKELREQDKKSKDAEKKGDDKKSRDKR